MHEFLQMCDVRPMPENPMFTPCEKDEQNKLDIYNFPSTLLEHSKRDKLENPLYLNDKNLQDLVEYITTDVTTADVPDTSKNITEEENEVSNLFDVSDMNSLFSQPVPHIKMQTRSINPFINYEETDNYAEYNLFNEVVPNSTVNNPTDQVSFIF